MGKRGPKPTPTAILKLRGSWLAATRENEPQTNPEVVACPSWMSSGARDHWDEIHPMLLGWGVMAKPYRAALALLVDALADWVALAKELENATPATAGFIRKHKSDAWKRALAALREFGMTPAAVTAIRKIEKKDERPLDKFKIA